MIEKIKQKIMIAGLLYQLSTTPLQTQKPEIREKYKPQYEIKQYEVKQNV